MSASLTFRPTLYFRRSSRQTTANPVADLIAQSYARSFGLPVNIIRWGNIFGGGDLHFSRLIPRLMQCFVSGEPVELRDDGKQVRSYLHVADAIEGYLSLSRQAAERGVSRRGVQYGRRDSVDVAGGF